MVLPEGKESSSCFCFPQPLHSPAIDWKRITKGSTFSRSSLILTFFLTSYQNLLFVTAFELKDEVFICEKSVTSIFCHFSQPSLWLFSSSTDPPLFDNIIKLCQEASRSGSLLQAYALHTGVQPLPHQETLVS